MDVASSMRLIQEKKGALEVDSYLTSVATGEIETDEDSLVLRLDAARRWLSNETEIFAGIRVDENAALRTPTLSGRVATGIDLFAYLLLPDVSELLVFGFTSNPETRAEISATAVYEEAFKAVVVDLGGYNQSTTGVDTDAITDVRNEIEATRDIINKSLEKNIANLAEDMRQDAIKRGVLGETPTSTWKAQYGTSQNVNFGDTPERRRALAEVFKRFSDERAKQVKDKGIETTFDEVYNNLDKKSRKVLALSVWLVPYSGTDGRPRPGTKEYSSFFNQGDGKEMLLKITENDPELTGKKLTATIKF